MSSMENLSSSDDDRGRLSSSSNSTVEGRPLFTSEERAILCGKAAEYLAKGHFTKVDVLYRNKPQQYFDSIRAQAEETGNDEIMMGYNKNATGHQENGINWQLDGCFFATMTIREKPPPWSPFGDTRLSVDADHLLAPNKTSLFFADFFCVRNHRNPKHMIILVACPRGSKAEQQCVENTLYKLNILDNPFLRLNVTVTASTRFNGSKAHSFMPSLFNISANYYVAATANEDTINVFYAGDFNITEALRLRKCHFTKTGTSDRGYVDRRGLEVSKNCNICNVLPQPTPLSLTELIAAGQWRLWEFVCRDLPWHACRQVNQRANQQINRDFGIEVEKICRQRVQLHGDVPGVFSFDNWDDYLYEKEIIFATAKAMVECVETNEYLWLSLMLRNTFFDNHLGIALFRDGITPDYNCPYNRNGGYFQLRLLGRKNDDCFMQEMDALFCNFLHYIVLGLGPNMVKLVNGVFVRCEVCMSGYRADDSVDDFAGIPIVIKLEVWINDRNEQSKFSRVLDRWGQRELPNDARIFPSAGPPEHTKGKFIPYF